MRANAEEQPGTLRSPIPPPSLTRPPFPRHRRRYELGQKYSAHFDVHGSEQQTVLEARRGVKGGQRYATLLMYLSGEGAGIAAGPANVCVSAFVSKGKEGGDSPSSAQSHRLSSCRLNTQHDATAGPVVPALGSGPPKRHTRTRTHP